MGNTAHSDLRIPTLATQHTPTYAIKHWQQSTQLLTRFVVGDYGSSQVKAAAITNIAFNLESSAGQAAAFLFPLTVLWFGGSGNSHVKAAALPHTAFNV